ncbi:MAG TPA: AraC family transcriptional regulator [Duganella sp.]|nr:AraC family transcriptional regulator [Duganella sp.]
MLLAGSADFEHEGGRLRVEVPTLVLYPRPCAHAIAAAGTAQLLCAEIVALGNPSRLMGSLPVVIDVPLADLPGVEDVLARLSAAPAGSGTRTDASGRLVDRVLIRLLRQLLADRSSIAAPLRLRDSGVSKAVVAMQEAPGTAWTVAALADLCGMSRSKFARRFREAVGVTPADYLLGQRMRLAKGLLQRGRQVQDVACAVGYSTQPAFTRAFRAACRQSPREWMQQAA